MLLGNSFLSRFCFCFAAFAAFAAYAAELFPLFFLSPGSNSYEGSLLLIGEVTCAAVGSLGAELGGYRTGGGWLPPDLWVLSWVGTVREERGYPPIFGCWVGWVPYGRSVVTPQQKRLHLHLKPWKKQLRQKDPHPLLKETTKNSKIWEIWAVLSESFFKQ